MLLDDATVTSAFKSMTWRIYADFNASRIGECFLIKPSTKSGGGEGEWRTGSTGLMKAMKKVTLEEDATNEHKRVLNELKQQDNFGWTIMSKRHTYTDGVHERISTEGLIIVVKKPFLQLSQEIFAMI